MNKGNVIYDGVSNEVLDIKEIDKAIRDFILLLNENPDIESAGSCSGHPAKDYTEAYIYFKKIPDYILDFFKENEFQVGKVSENEWIYATILLEKSSSEITQKDIENFWKYIVEKYKSYLIE